MLGCVIVAALLLASASVAAMQGPRFRADDPIREDPDRTLSIPQPAVRSLSKSIDLLQKTFRPPEGGSREAVNVNTLGEVPDSSWFTNRLSTRELGLDELVRGPNLGAGPDMSTRWRIVGAKTEGITPGLRIRDARNDMYFIKFDPAAWPQMATSAEVIGTKLFWAMGYNVPENYLVRWIPDYDVDPTATVEWDDGHRDRLSRAYVRKLLSMVPRRPDGTIQLLASKRLPGVAIGPFDYQGTRRDDPNDIFNHEDRRELRALRVFTAWVNHNDSDAVNTLDMYQTDSEGRSYVIHYLIDFGTILGSGATQPHARRAGNEYYLELAPSLRAALTLGIWDRPWRHVEYEVLPSVGRFESTYFQPEKWKPDYPNPAHDKMTLQDALWATRILLRFSDAGIRAVVATGQYDDAAAAHHISERLIERRDKLARYWLARVNPIDGFRIVEAAGERRLAFSNLGVAAGLASSCAYGYAWHTFDNESGVVQALGTPGIAPEPSLTLPGPVDDFLMVEISTACPRWPAWSSEVRVWVRGGPRLEVVGIERDDAPAVNDG